MQDYPQIPLYGTSGSAPTPPPAPPAGGAFAPHAPPHLPPASGGYPTGHQQQPYGQPQQQYPSITPGIGSYPAPYPPPPTQPGSHHLNPTPNYVYPGTNISPLPTMPVMPSGHGSATHTAPKPSPQHSFGAPFGAAHPFGATIGSALGALTGAISSATGGSMGQQQHHHRPAAAQPPAPHHYTNAAPAGGGYAPLAAPQHTPPQQQQFVQQHQQQQGGASAACVVVSPVYCSPGPLDLVVQEGVSNGVTGGDSFLVTDTQGRVYFRQSTRLMSLSDRRSILDASGAPAVSMAKRLIALKPTWEVFRGGSFDQGSRIATVKSNLLTLTPSVSVYLNDGNSESDYKIRGSFRAKKFTVSAKLPGGGERVVAEIKKESRFASATAFLMAAVTDADKYFVHIEPGVDSAFIVALTTLVDEFFQDKS